MGFQPDRGPLLTRKRGPPPQTNPQKKKPKKRTNERKGPPNKSLFLVDEQKKNPQGKWGEKKKKRGELVSNPQPPPPTLFPFFGNPKKVFVLKNGKKGGQNIFPRCKSPSLRSPQKMPNKKKHNPKKKMPPGAGGIPGRPQEPQHVALWGNICPYQLEKTIRKGPPRVWGKPQTGKKRKPKTPPTKPTPQP